jgi:hypothetical protein
MHAKLRLKLRSGKKSFKSWGSLVSKEPDVQWHGEDAYPDFCRLPEDGDKSVYIIKIYKIAPLPQM